MCRTISWTISLPHKNLPKFISNDSIFLVFCFNDVKARVFRYGHIIDESFLLFSHFSVSIENPVTMMEKYWATVAFNCHNFGIDSVRCGLFVAENEWLDKRTGELVIGYIFFPYIIQLFATIFSHLTFVALQTNILLRTIDSMFIFFRKNFNTKEAKDCNFHLLSSKVKCLILWKCLLFLCSRITSTDYIMFSYTFTVAFHFLFFFSWNSFIWNSKGLMLQRFCYKCHSPKKSVFVLEDETRQPNAYTKW